MADNPPPLTFAAWFPKFLLQWLLWNAGVIGTVRGYVWALGLDETYQTVAAEHRQIILAIFIIGSVVYARMDWIRKTEP